MNEDVPPPSEAASGIPTELDDAVLTATSRDPNQRPADASALLQKVRAIPRQPTTIDLHETMVVPIPVGVGAAGATRHDTAVNLAPAGVDPSAVIISPPEPPNGSEPPQATPGERALDPERHRKRSRRRGFIALAIVLILAVAAGAFAWWLGEGRYTTVPRVVGLTAQAAEAQLEEQGLTVKYGEERFSEIVAAGQVINSNPAQGDEIESGGTVTLIVSKGPERYDVPKVVGKPLDKAKEAIRQRNLAVGDIERKYSNTVAQGVVMSAAPKPGESVRPDTAVDLVVSKGLPPVTVPNLVGESESTAQAALDKLNLGYQKTGEKRHASIPEGAVISQSPASGSSVAQGTTVSVVISLGPPLAEVPDVVDMPLDDAIAELTDAGFKYDTYEPFGVSPLNRVATQDPEGGTMAPKGSVIRLGIF